MTAHPPLVKMYTLHKKPRTKRKAFTVQYENRKLLSIALHFLLLFSPSPSTSCGEQ